MELLHSASNIMDYVTMDSTGNATDFGDLTASKICTFWCFKSNKSIVFGGGTPKQNVIDFVEISTTGNATDFGDLTSGRSDHAGGSSSTRACFSGGANGGSQSLIEFVNNCITR